MARRCSWDQVLLRALGGSFCGCLAMQDGDMAARLQLVLPIDNDLLVRAKPAIDQRLSLTDLRDVYRTHRDRVVGIDHIREGTLLTLLHRRRLDGEPVMARIDEQPDINEFTRPEPMGRVG